MILIGNKEKVLLPKKYHRLNNLCAVIYDQMTEIYVDHNYKGLTETSFDLDEKNHTLIRELKKGKIHILDWLKDNNLNDELRDTLVKHLTMAIVSDFINFIYESLSCAKRGKMTVAYALLRKPLTDELFILEQLLIDPNEFIQKFYHIGDPSNYDPGNRKVDKRHVIKTAIAMVSPNLMFREEIIYELRYDKASQIGINGISNHALHIVTNDKNYKTENQNLNFVFSNMDDITSNWDHYYYFVPYLLLYAVSVIDAIIFRYLPDDENINLQAVKSFRRLVGVLLYTEWTSLNMKESIKKMYASFYKLIVFECETCSKKVKLRKSDFAFFFNTELILCPSCSENLLSTPESTGPIKDYMDIIN